MVGSRIFRGSGGARRARPRAAGRPSIYEQRFQGRPGASEGEWRKIGELDPRTGAWIDGRPQWPGRR